MVFMLLVKETVSLPQPTWTDWLKLNATTIYTIKIWRIECLFTFKWVHSVCIHFFFICSFFFTMSFAPCRQTLTNSFAPCQHVFTMSFAPCQNTTTCVLIFTWSFGLYIILIPPNLMLNAPSFWKLKIAKRGCTYRVSHNSWHESKA